MPERVVRAHVAILIVSSLTAACAPVRAQTMPTPASATAPSPRPDARADTAALRRALDSIADAHRGVVGYRITNLETGEHLERRGDETFTTASLIKVPILVALFDLAEKQQLSLDDPVVLTEIDKVGGAGELQFLRTPLTLRLWDVAWLMSTLSDNTATNIILDRSQAVEQIDNR